MLLLTASTSVVLLRGKICQLGSVVLPTLDRQHPSIALRDELFSFAANKVFSLTTNLSRCQCASSNDSSY